MTSKTKKLLKTLIFGIPLLLTNPHPSNAQEYLLFPEGSLPQEWQGKNLRVPSPKTQNNIPDGFAGEIYIPCNNCLYPDEWQPINSARDSYYSTNYFNNPNKSTKTTTYKQKQTFEDKLLASIDNQNISKENYIIQNFGNQQKNDNKRYQRSWLSDRDFNKISNHYKLNSNTSGATDMQNRLKYVQFIYDMCEFYKMPEELIPYTIANIHTESTFKPKIKSSAGALGIAQFMRGTANKYGLGDRTNPVKSIDASIRYILDIYNIKKGKITQTFAAYNYGENASKSDYIKNRQASQHAGRVSMRADEYKLICKKIKQIRSSSRS